MAAFTSSVSLAHWTSFSVTVMLESWHIRHATGSPCQNFDARGDFYHYGIAYIGREKGDPCTP